MTSSFLLFLLHRRLFGVRLKGAIEIVPWRPLRPVPLSYSYVEGLLDYRGTIYPVHNLGRLLGLAKTVAGDGGDQKGGSPAGQSIILLEENGLPFGIVVDTVLKMTKLEEPSPAPEKVRDMDPEIC